MIATAALLGVIASTGVSAHQIDPNDCAGRITAYETPAGIFYTDDHGPEPTGAPGVHEFWIYQESNDHEGLQKGGYEAVLVVVLGEDETEAQGFFDACNTATHKSHPKDLQPDTVLF